MSRDFWYIDDEEKLEGVSPKYRNRIAGHSPRILIPFCDKRGNMFGLQGRTLDGKGLRYLTLRLTEDKGELIYGLDRWNSSNHTYVCEGPLDSLFLPNALAVGGSSYKKVRQFLDRDRTTIIYDNEPRNKEIISQMRKAIQDGWGLFFWPDKITEKDINDLVNVGQGPGKILEMINKSTAKGLAATVRLNAWKKI
jgi:hypothetical protein